MSVQEVYMLVAALIRLLKTILGTAFRYVGLPLLLLIGTLSLMGSPNRSLQAISNSSNNIFLSTFILAFMVSLFILADVMIRAFLRKAIKLEILAYFIIALPYAIVFRKYGKVFWDKGSQNFTSELNNLLQSKSYQYSLSLLMVTCTLLALVMVFSRVDAVSNYLTHLSRRIFNTFKKPYYKTLEEIDSLPQEERGKAFEFWVADLANKHLGKAVTTEQLKYEGKLRKGPGDQGVDVVVHTHKGEKLIIQCKYYTSSVSNSAVQEIVAAKALYKADKLMIITNSTLTSAAKELAKANNVDYWDYQKLSKILGKELKLNANFTEEYTQEQFESAMRAACKKA